VLEPPPLYLPLCLYPDSVSSEHMGMEDGPRAPPAPLPTLIPPPQICRHRKAGWLNSSLRLSLPSPLVLLRSLRVVSSVRMEFRDHSCARHGSRSNYASRSRHALPRLGEALDYEPDQAGTKTTPESTYNCLPLPPRRPLFALCFVSSSSTIRSLSPLFSNFRHDYHLVNTSSVESYSACTRLSNEVRL